MTRIVSALVILFFPLAGPALYSSSVPFAVDECLNNAYAQTPERESSKVENGLSINEEPEMSEHRGRTMMRGGMEGMTAEEMREIMRERMRDAISPEVPFYQEKTFLVIATAAFVLVVVWLIRRWGIRSRRTFGKRGSFVNEAILVVDLCESTKLAVTQGDVFAMRIKNKMKQCVREVSQSFGASFFESIGDGYLISFPTGTGAVRAAVKILQNADDYNKDASEKEKIELRVGINYGELVLDEQGGRHGAAINKAFRIEGLKKEEQQSLGGGLKPEDFPEKNRIFVSEETKEEIKGVREIQVQLVGVFDLKGFTGLHRIYSIPWKDIASDK